MVTSVIQQWHIMRDCSIIVLKKSDRAMIASFPPPEFKRDCVDD